MIILGTYDPRGKLIRYPDPVKVQVVNDQLVDHDLWVWGKRNAAGEWINAYLALIGVEVKLRVDNGK